MVLTKTELIGQLEHEINILLHLVSKVEATMLDYRPTPGQRSLLELLRYMTIFGPIHLRTICAGVWEMDAWRDAWQTEEAAANARSLEEIRDEIGRQRALFAGLLGSLSDAALREEMQMFGRKQSRGSWLVRMVLSHYVAYRMQLFLYLKDCGLRDLSTMNLWAGMDA